MLNHTIYEQTLRPYFAALCMTYGGIYAGLGGGGAGGGCARRAIVFGVSSKCLLATVEGSCFSVPQPLAVSSLWLNRCCCPCVMCYALFLFCAVDLNR